MLSSTLFNVTVDDEPSADLIVNSVGPKGFLNMGSATAADTPEI